MNLTIYIPTYRRDSLDACLNSIVSQFNTNLEIIVSDNDQDCYASNIVSKYKNYVTEYSVRKQNIGCDGNCLYGITAGTSEYVWVVGDDDIILPGAIDAIMPMLNGVDRIMQFAPYSGEVIPGFSGTMAGLINRLNDKSFLIAATLASMNIWKRDVMDFKIGTKHLDSRNVLAWSGINCKTVSIPDIPTVLVNDTNLFEFRDFDNVMFEYCDALSDIDGVEKFTFHNANKWNFVSASMEKK
jgi:glycosyltransferase involved in cell wall biosynthesis